MKSLLLCHLKQNRWSEKVSWLKTEVKSEKKRSVKTLVRQTSMRRDRFKADQSLRSEEKRRHTCLFKK